jgi:hypothetical protein
MRTTRSEVTFTASFNLPELEAPQPAGTYKVETDEEIVEGNERTVYIRWATLLYLTNGGSTSIISVDPTSLAAALARDANVAGSR